MTGLNLLRLLVQNRIAEFHTELELLPQQVCLPISGCFRGVSSKVFGFGQHCSTWCGFQSRHVRFLSCVVCPEP